MTGIDFCPMTVTLAHQTPIGQQFYRQLSMYFLQISSSLLVQFCTTFRDFLH
jgi:hypothetical protein